MPRKRRDFINDTDDRETPAELFNPLDKEFQFQVDVCAWKWNAKLPLYFSPDKNGLKQEWAPMRCFMNCPYSDIPTWLTKARDEAMKGALVVSILPLDSSTKWFHEFVWDQDLNRFKPGIDVRFPKGRYKFGKYANTPKFATMIVIFLPQTDELDRTHR